MSHRNQGTQPKFHHVVALAAVFASTCGVFLFLPSCKPDDSNWSRGDLPSASPQDAESTGASGPEQTAAGQRPQTFALATEDREKLATQWHRTDDPLRDGWDTEAFSAMATAQLKRVGKIIEQRMELAAAKLDDISTSDFSGAELSPTDLELVFSNEHFRIERRTDAQGEPAHTFSGYEGLRNAMQQVLQPLAKAKAIRTKFKIFRVQLDKEKTTTRQYVEITGLFEDGVIEQHATWEAAWRQTPGAAPLLASLDVVDFEQVRTHGLTGTLFTDCTRSVLEDNSCYAQQFLHGYGYWMLQRLYTRYHIIEMMGHPGLAIGDVNGDGLADLYVCQEQGLPNRLFLQNEDGTADEVAAAWGVDWLQACRSALLLDLDNDGDQDLVVSFLGGVLVASNEADAGFRVRTVLSTGDDMMSLAAADYDNDGDLDIYATAYYADKTLSERQVAGLPAATDKFVYHDANVGGTNTMLRNDIQGDDWAFADVTEQVGLVVNNTRYTLAASWEDYDNDGDQDLYVANDYGRDNLYRNDGGRFVDVAEEVGAEDAASGMSVTWSDFDRDGWLDVYVSNMWSAAGNRIAFQPRFKRGAPAEVKQRLQRFARGNTLLRNNGQERFLDVSAHAGVEMGRWAWGSLFADINNDGWDDILIANGFITRDGDSGDL